MPHSRKSYGLLFILLAICLFGQIAQAKYGGGTGEPNEPYRIATAEDLMLLGNSPEDYDKHFILTADIDLDPKLPGGKVFHKAVIAPDVNDTEKWFQGTPFTGVFDANDMKITNFSHTSIDKDYVGLFGHVKLAEIRDLVLIDPNVDAGMGDYVGSLVGYLCGGNIAGCYVQDGSVSGQDYVGGLVGSNGSSDDNLPPCYFDGTITNCYAEGGSVSGNYSVGGLVGRNSSDGTITNCYSTGSVSGTMWYVGGLVGFNDYGGKITDCYAQGGSVSGQYYVGGLVGRNRSTITTSFSTVSVLGTGGSVGGLVGINDGTITNSYSTGSVSGTSYVGGLVGSNNWCTGSSIRKVLCYSGTITNCYSTGIVLGNLSVGGLVGSNGTSRSHGHIMDSFWDTQTSDQTSSAGGTGKKTAEMQIESTFSSWLCSHVWTIDEGRDYPRLWWQNMPGEALTTPYYGGGCGAAEEPYLIYTAEHLNAIGAHAEDWDKQFKLMDDIELAGFTGRSFNIIGNYYIPFTGVFDGNRHIISNFTYSSSNMDRIGFFGCINDRNAEIKDLGLIEPNVNTGTVDYVGVLVGYMIDGAISRCYVDGGSISGNCTVGGLAGYNWGTITNCYSRVRVSGNDDVGGLVGSNSGTILNCYSTGRVLGTMDVGGLIGSKSEYGAPTVMDSFWDTQTSGQTSSAGGTGKKTAEMKMKGTFTDAGWDFVVESVNGINDTWCICEGVEYPKLNCQFVIGDFDSDDDVDFADFCIFAIHWLGTDSGFWCFGGGTDLTNDGHIDINDFKELSDNWLEGRIAPPPSPVSPQPQRPRRR